MRDPLIERVPGGRPRRPSWRVIALIVAALCLVACASPPAGERPAFDFQRETFTFANELVWEYEIVGDRGTQSGSARAEEVEFGQRCPLIVRSARQFHYAARFEPGLPRLDGKDYRELVKRVMDSDPRREILSPEPVVIPGYESLRSFSSDHEPLLMDAIGGRLQSYFQRGNWRMIFPFSTRHQKKVSDQLVEAISQGRLPIVRLVQFPKITINHSLMIFDAEESPREIRFATYDPNDVERPLPLVYDRSERRFSFPKTDYFAGGPVNVYEIYNSLLY